MNVLKQVSIVIVLLVPSLGAVAQITNTKSIDIKNLKQPTFTFELEMLSNSVWAGRQSSIPSSYLTPSITYHHKRSYLTASLTYQNKQGYIDNYSIVLGDTLRLFNNMDVYGSVEGSFFSINSTNILASNNYTLAGGLTYNLGSFSFSADGTLVFLKDPRIKGTDQFISFSVAYNYALGKWNINPTVMNSLGTRKFFMINRSNFFENEHPNYIYEVFNPVANKLQILDYEMSLPITYTAHYKRKQWSLSFTPTWAIPVNNLIYTISRTPVLHEGHFVFRGLDEPSIKPIWYFDITLSANF